MSEIVESLAMITLKSGATLTIKDYEDEIDYDKITIFFDKILSKLKDRSINPSEIKGGYFQYGHTVVMMDEITSIIVNESLYERRKLVSATSLKDTIKLKGSAMVAGHVYDIAKQGHITETIGLDMCPNEDEED